MRNRLANSVRKARHLRAQLLGALALIASATACGDGGGAVAPKPQPSIPPTVASVVIASSIATLVPQQTQTLVATAKDASGAALTDRAIAWSSSNASVATITSTGVVTALAIGTATISASSEGKNATINVTVEQGKIIGPTGGSVTFNNNTVRLDIPSGAVTSNVPITITELAQPRQTLPTGRSLVGAMYSLGPNGTTFAKPVTVTIKYDAAKLPPWTMTGDVGVLHLSGTNWSTLANAKIDTAARTLSGTTTSFSDVGNYVEVPEVVLTPANGSVNATHRNVVFDISVTPRGKAMESNFSKPPFLYRWRTSGKNGSLSGPGPTEWTTTARMQYTATNPVLGQLSGKIDDVTVDVLLNPEVLLSPQGGDRIYVTKTANIDADLNFILELTPDDVMIGAGGTTNIRLIATTKQGNPLDVSQYYIKEWSSSNIHGKFIRNADAMSGTYTARTVFDRPPPRVDLITCIVRQERRETERVVRVAPGGIQMNDLVENVDTIEVASLKSTVNVKVNYKVSVSPSFDSTQVGGVIPLNVTLDPPYNGPGLKYRYTLTGSRGIVDVPVNTFSDAATAKYTGANATSGEDVLKVEVVTLFNGSINETIGSAQSRLKVFDDTVNVFWKFTTFSGPSTMPPDSVLHIPTSAYFSMFKALIDNPSSGYFYTGPYSNTVLGSLSRVFGVAHDPSQRLWLLNFPVGYPSCTLPSFPNSFTVTGGVTSGSIKGRLLASCAGTFDNPTVLFKTMWIEVDANKSGTTLHGVIRLSNQNVIFRPSTMVARNAIVLPLQTYEYTFTATRAPHGPANDFPCRYVC